MTGPTTSGSTNASVRSRPVVDAFSSQVKEMVAAADDRRMQDARAMNAMMAAREDLEARFAPIAEALQSNVISPLLEALARQFDGAHLDHLKSLTGVQSRCTIGRSDRYPASVTLTVGVMLDVNERAARLFQTLQIVPMLFEFDKGSSMAVPLDALDETEATAWLQGRLLAFVGTYLRLETDPNYQRDNEVTDPVCGMRVSAASTEHHRQHGRHTYSFCSSACEAKFAADPDFYLKPAGRGA